MSDELRPFESVPEHVERRILEICDLPASERSIMAERFCNEHPLAGLLVAVQALVLDGAAASGIGAVTNAGMLRLY